jgi:hypothetical protein
LSTVKYTCENVKENLDEHVQVDRAFFGEVSADLASMRKTCPFVTGERKLVIIITDHWLKSWFTKFLLPASRFAHLVESDIEWFDLRDGTWDENFHRLRALLLELGDKARCYSCSDPPMDLYSAVCESLKGEVELTGASFISFWLATNKLATRKAIAGGSGLRSEGVYSDMDFVPDLGVDGFFKPVSGCGSKGVFHCKAGEKVANPLKGCTNLSSSGKVEELAARYEETQPYLDRNLVGLVEEYVPPASQKVLAFDGFVHEGKIHHYCILDNVYHDDDPTDFDRLVVPSQVAPEGSPAAEAGWRLFDEIVGDLVKKGLNNQFVDLEAFLLPDGRVVMMELNCRTDGNPGPLFGRVFGREGDCFSTALELLSREAPPDAVVKPDSQGRLGVILYRQEVRGAPEFEASEDGRCLFYNAPGYWSHVFVVGVEGEMALRQMAVDFYEKMQAKGAAVRSAGA